MPAINASTHGSHPPNNRTKASSSLARSSDRTPRLVETYNSLLTPVLARVCCANFSWTSRKECPRVNVVWRGYHWLLPDANLATLLEAMLTVPKRQRAGNHELARLVRPSRFPTHIVCSCNCYTIFKRMPTHMKDLLVEVYLICVGLFPHPTTLACSARCWAACS